MLYFTHGKRIKNVVFLFDKRRVNIFSVTGQTRTEDDYEPDVMAEDGNYAGGKGHFCQLNSLWSVWYGLLATVLNVYSVLLATRRLSGKAT